VPSPTSVVVAATTPHHTTPHHTTPHHTTPHHTTPHHTTPHHTTPPPRRCRSLDGCTPRATGPLCCLAAGSSAGSTGSVSGGEAGRPGTGPRRRRGLAGGGGAVYLDGVSTAHADPPSPTWAQAAADAAAQAAEGGEAVLVLPDGTAAVLMSKSRVVQLHDQLDGLGETRSVLGSRRSRTRLLRGLADVTAGRTHGAADAAAALARHPGRR